MAKPKKKKARLQPTSCPCGLGKRYLGCCGPLHEGSAEAADAVQLVRGRFSAYATGRVDYLWRTLHSGHDDRALGREAYVSRVQRSLVSCRYRGLQILDARAPDDDGMAHVLFVASIAQHNQDLSVVEQSMFVQEDGQWRYIAGNAQPRSALSHALQDMKIDHWQCADHHH